MSEPTRRHDVEALLTALGDYLEARYGRQAKDIRVRFYDGSEFRAPFPRGAARIDAYRGHHARGRADGGVSCADGILCVLREVGHRMTRTHLLREMSRRGLEWSERMVAGELARMVQAGELTSDPDASPKGYGLAEWTTGPADS